MKNIFICLFVMLFISIGCKKESETEIAKTNLIKSDTLDSIAQKRGVDFDNLRHYHNIRCEIKDCIGADFPSHLKLLIVSPEKEESVIEDRIPERVYARIK